MKLVATRHKIGKLAQEYLWSESGGHCQNPACRRDLHAISKRVSVSELAHIIPASDGGPRGESDQHLDDDQRAAANNILLLCPTCHTAIDKDPAEYPIERLRGWKNISIAARTAAFGTPRFKTRAEAHAKLVSLLAKNWKVFDKYGPQAGGLDEDRAALWAKFVKSTVIPVNRQVLAHIRANEHLLTASEAATVAEFEIHAGQLEDRHLGGNWAAGTLTFPADVPRLFEEEGS
jgi:hypothetical protein